MTVLSVCKLEVSEAAILNAFGVFLDVCNLACRFVMAFCVFWRYDSVSCVAGIRSCNNRDKMLVNLKNETV